MDRVSLLECTLRDGGYVTSWHFEEKVIKDMIQGLVDAGLDYIEVGYLNHKAYETGTTQFSSIEQIEGYLPKHHRETVFLAMADVQQFLPEDIPPCTGKSVDGIRVVFYKHQTQAALALAEAAAEAGYKLFVQPMVTIDYSIDEYAQTVKKFAALNPYAVSIVDSFGYMTKTDFRRYFKVLDNILDQQVSIGFHSHNNMNLAFLTAQDVFDYNTLRRTIIDCSLYGMGRGAGNLNTELIANYYNMTLGNKYDCMKIIGLISRHIMPIAEKTQWGYTPYLFLTGMMHCHPNFACYLLEAHPEVAVAEFAEYLKMIPAEMRTKCRREYVADIWEDFKNQREADSYSRIEQAKKTEKVGHLQ